MKDKAKKEKLIWLLIATALLGLSAVAVVRSLIIGLDIDEQYAVTLAYRIARGDILVKEVWEPHQTSALLPALLTKLFLLCKGNSEYLVLYLRGMGVLFQLCVSVSWFCVIRKNYGDKAGFLSAVIVFHTLPKGIVTPEFANQQIWLLLMVLLCVLQYNRTRKICHCAVAGIFMTLEVLAYPSCILLFPIYIVVLWKLEKKKPEKKGHAGTALFAGECVLAAVLFMTYLLLHMPASELFACVGYILADGEHSAGMGEKLVAYMGELPEIAGYLARYALAGGAVTGLIALIRRMRKKKTDAGAVFIWFFLFAALADQIRLWALGRVANVHPQIHYLILFALGGVLYFRCTQRDNEDDTEKVMFWAGWIPALTALACVLLMTNLDVKASLVHLFPGMLCALLWWMKKTNGSKRATAMLLLWCVTLIGARTYLVRDGGYNRETVLVVKQKVLDSAAKYIYAPYSTGYGLNAEYDFLTENLPQDSRIWYLGYHTLIYLMGEQQVCSASTISTPVYDQRYLAYFDMNPDKMPEYVVADRGMWEGDAAEIRPEVRQWIQENYERVESADSAYCLIMRRKQ